MDTDIKRCGQCSACLYVEATRKIVLACANPPFSHVHDREVKMWNAALKNNPCNGDPSTGDKIRANEEKLREAKRRRASYQYAQLQRLSEQSCRRN